MLMRNTDGFSAPVSVRVRVCVTNFTGSNNSVNLYIWTTGNPWDTPPLMPLQQTRHLELGECVEIDQPAAVVIQDSTISGIASGYYELLDLQPNVPPSGVPVRGQPHDPKYRGSSVYLSKDPTNHQAKCEHASESRNYIKQCKLELDPKTADPDKLPVRGVRICTGDKFVGVVDPPPPSPPPAPPPVYSYIDYPAGLLELIINKSFLPPINKPQDYDYNWNPVTPNGCRDVIAGTNNTLDSIYFMVGPVQAVPPWDAERVEKISVWTQWIYWK